MLFLTYLLLGAFAGLLAGLFGIGGGLIIVPVLMMSFTTLGFAPSTVTHLALGTSLPTMIITGLSALQLHHKAGCLDVALLKRLAPAMLLGAWGGAQLAAFLPASQLNLLIGLFAWSMALHMGLGLKPRTARTRPNRPGLWLAGGVIGALSALFGIGGGSLTVPYLTWRGIAMRHAVAAASACSIPIALSGSLSYLYSGYGEAGLPAWSVGYIYLPALLGIVLTSAPFARLGAKLTARVPPARLKQGFACLMLLVGAKFMFWS
ncbi:MAG: sulfite exporter TauE/SafE family protein [Aeromonas sp.]